MIDSQGILNINVIGDGTITNAKIADTTITGTKLANDTITSAQIAPNAVTASELADNAVDTAAIAAGAVTDAKIANNAVNNTKISDVAASKVTGLLKIVPPRPIKGTGTELGVWKGTFLFDGNFVLPAGGTWAYLVTYYQNSTYRPVIASVCGVGSGGTQLTNYGNALYSTLLWRIQ